MNKGKASGVTYYGLKKLKISLTNVEQTVSRSRIGSEKMSITMQAPKISISEFATLLFITKFHTNVKHFRR